MGTHRALKRGSEDSTILESNLYEYGCSMQSMVARRGLVNGTLIMPHLSDPRTLLDGIQNGPEDTRERFFSQTKK